MQDVTPTNTARLAVLIDSDNTTATLTTELLEEIAKYGTPTVKRAYGDWTTQHLVAWKEELLEHAIQPPQGWEYLWFIGPSEIYKDCDGHGRDHGKGERVQACCLVEHRLRVAVLEDARSQRPKQGQGRESQAKGGQCQGQSLAGRCHREASCW